MFKALKALFGGSSDRPDTPSVPALDEAKLAPFRRSCWKPVVVAEAGGAASSKFAGSIGVRPGEAWPLCRSCGKPIQLFLQINTTELPDGFSHPWGNSLFQFFYCVNSEPCCEVDCDAWQAFSTSTLFRVVPLAEATAICEPPEGSFPPKRIASWEAADDLPGWEELESAGFSEVELEEIGNLGFPREGDKLGGWPYWVQSVEYPDCPVCKQPMQLVFQIDSEVNVPYMFGDAGCGHVTVCPQHPDQIAFAWACH